MDFLKSFLDEKKIEYTEIEEFPFVINVFLKSYFQITKYFPELSEIKWKEQKKISFFPTTEVELEVEQIRERINKKFIEIFFFSDVFYSREDNILYLSLQEGFSFLESDKKNELFNFIWENFSTNIKILKTIDTQLNSFKKSIQLLNSSFEFRKNLFQELKLQATIERVPTWGRISFLGGASEVGRSCYLFETDFFSILFDIGINFSKKNTQPYVELLQQQASKLIAVFITHAHMDHCGLLPFLIQSKYKGPIFMSAPTKNLFFVSITDFLMLIKNKVERPFSAIDVTNVLKQIITLEPNLSFNLFKNITITPRIAGHILGAYMYEYFDAKGNIRGLFSGDMKDVPTEILEKAYLPQKELDWLVCESTSAGNKLEVDRDAEKKKFKELILQNYLKGNILIPVFSIGRSQEVLFALRELLLTDNQFNKSSNILVEGMIKEINAIHITHSEFLKKKIKKEIFFSDDSIFYNLKFKYTDMKSREKEFFSRNIVVSTSGMLTGGPILEFIKTCANQKEDMIILTGFQAKNTLGFKLLNEPRNLLPIYFNIPEKDFKIQVSSVAHFSGHCYRQELKSFLESIKFKSKNSKLIFVHGERAGCLHFKKIIEKTIFVEIFVPRNLDVLRIF